MDFGAHLRHARENRGISLRQIAAATKISVSALEALERNDISRLPGGIFSRAFVRAYATEVGLDPEETVKQFLTRFPLESVTTGSPYTRDSGEYEAYESERQVAGTFVRLLAVSLPLIGVILYFTLGGSVGPTDRSEVAGEPAGASAPLETGTPAAVDRAAPPARIGDPGVERPGPRAAETPAAEETPSAAPVQESPTAAPAALTPPDTSVPEPPAAVVPEEQAAEGLTIGLLARGPCWVSLRVDGRSAVARLMQAGERERFQAAREIVLNVGDAGALTFAINELQGRPLGSAGEVVTVRITPDNFREYVTRE